MKTTKSYDEERQEMIWWKLRKNAECMKIVKSYGSNLDLF